MTSAVIAAAAAIEGMTDCAAAGTPLSSPAPSAHRCAAAGLDSGAPAERFGIHAFDAAMDRLRGLGRAWDLPGIGGASRCGQLGHDFNLHVAVLQLPFVVLLEQHRADQPDDRGFIGENANNVGTALDFFVEPFARHLYPAEIVGRSVESHAELRCPRPPDWG